METRNSVHHVLDLPPLYLITLYSQVGFERSIYKDPTYRSEMNIETM